MPECLGLNYYEMACFGSPLLVVRLTEFTLFVLITWAPLGRKFRGLALTKSLPSDNPTIDSCVQGAKKLENELEARVLGSPFWFRFVWG